MHPASKVHSSAYMQRLAALVKARLQPGADKAAIDARIWDIFGENWAVLYTDLSGFSRYVAEYGIIHFLQNILESQRIFEPCIDQHDGVLVKVEGDSLLVVFRQPAKAIECALDMQAAAREYNTGKAPEDQILPCAGIGYGRILTIGDQDVFGAEVNAACKLGEDKAGSWDIFVTEGVRAAAAGLPGITFERLAITPPGAEGAYRIVCTRAA
jgi:adenylate cyclase